MSQLERTILKESQMFREMLPSLLPSYAGKWVLFRDGGVVSVHATETDAYQAGVSKFGVEGGFVVAQVIETGPMPINVAVTFGLARA